MTRSRPIFIILFFLIGIVPLAGVEKEKALYFRGGLYVDWLGTQYESAGFTNRLSLRLKTELFNRRGNGWNLLLDTRSRWRMGEEGSGSVLLYDARLNFEKKGSPFFLSLGQLNLYDTAGLGQLMGGALGYKPHPDLLIGGYAGLESSAYVDRISQNYSKLGFFARYLGAKGKRLSLSFNQIRFSGETERRYLYLGTLLPVCRTLTFYSSLEYETAAQIRKQDRLTRLFTNLRWNPLEYLNVAAHISLGKGLDFHRFLIDRSKDPVLNDQELDRFYYSRQFGLRLTIKPAKGIRLYAARLESEQKDRNVRNNTWRLGASIRDLMGTGLSTYGSYSINRGKISESDSYYLSLTRDFGRLSCNLSFSNTFNGVRFDNRTGSAEIIHLNDYKTLSTLIFLFLSRMVSLSAEYEYFLQKEVDQHRFFVRLILRN